MTDLKPLFLAGENTSVLINTTAPYTQSKQLA